MKQLFMIPMIFAIVAICFTSYVNAETATVVVPFDSHGQSCSFDEITVEYHCIWQGLQEKFDFETLQEYRDILSDGMYDAEIAKLNESALAEIAIEKAKLTPNERTILEIEEKLLKGEATKDESVLMNLLKKLNTCKQGMDLQTAPFQTAREFEISHFNLWQINNVQYDGQIGVIVMAIEECRGQQALLKVVGDGYVGIATSNLIPDFSLSNIYTKDVQAIPFDQYTRTHTNIDMSLVCDNNQYTDVHKALFGCEVLYDGKTVAEIERENTIRFGNNGMINYQSESLDDYRDFLADYGNRIATIEDKQLQADIAEPIAKEMIEDNAFYQNQLKNEGIE